MNEFHGESNGAGRTQPTREYACWVQMRTRCSKSWKERRYYYDRGIVVCDRWDSYESFLSDMGRAPNGKTLDRIDNSKGYCPENCRWASATQQCYNRRGWSKTGLKGISTHGKKFRARIRAFGVLNNLGTYDNPEEASDVYNRVLTRIVASEIALAH